MRQLGPFAFDHSAHFIRDMVDVLYIEHVLVEAFYVGRHHDLAADETRTRPRRGGSKAVRARNQSSVVYEPTMDATEMPAK
jgi:hypothetical protein